jgi:hypothetical protein
MSFFGADPSAIIGHIGSAIGSLAPAPAPQASFVPGQGPGSGGFAPAPMVAGSNAWPTVTIGGGGFQPAQMQGGSFRPSGGLGGGFQPSGGLGGGFQPSGGIGGSPFQPSAQNPLLAPPKPATTSGATPGQGGGPSAGLSPGVAKWAGQAQQTFGDLLDPDIMLAIMENESGGDPNAYNAAGNAYGLFQQLNLGSNDPNVQFAAARTLAEEKLAGINAAYAKNGLNPDERTRALDFALAWAGHFDPARGRINPNRWTISSAWQTSQQLADIFLGNVRQDQGRATAAAVGRGHPRRPRLADDLRRAAAAVDHAGVRADRLLPGEREGLHLRHRLRPAAGEPPRRRLRDAARDQSLRAGRRRRGLRRRDGLLYTTTTATGRATGNC